MKTKFRNYKVKKNNSNIMWNIYRIILC
jgi:hypothetical protein